MERPVSYTHLRDVIHGFKTIFPIPLGQAASFNPQVAKDGEMCIRDSAVPGDTRFVDVNGDGSISADDRTNIGNGTPDWRCV